MLKRIFMSAMCVLLIGATRAQVEGADSNPTYKLRFSHIVSESTPMHKGAVIFADLVREKTKGKVIVDIFSNGSLINENRAAVEALEFGTVDVTLVNMVTLSGYTSRTKIFEFPYLLKNDAAADLIFDGLLGDKVYDELKDKGLVYMSSFSAGWREVTTSKREVHKPEDMKGLKLRTMESQIQMDYFNALGASAVPMAFSEVFTALQQGAIDGQENPYTNIYTQAFHEVQKYIIETDHICDIIPMLMAKTTYDKLPEDLRVIVLDCAKEAARMERKLVNAAEQEIRSAILATGKVTIISLTPEEKKAFYDAAQPVYEKWSAQIGADFIQEILDAQKDF
jgi:tripartite ATP-independent transporter DctP family solute receptor